MRHELGFEWTGSTLHGVVFAIFVQARRVTADSASKTRVNALRRVQDTRDR